MNRHMHVFIACIAALAVARAAAQDPGPLDARSLLRRQRAAMPTGGAGTTGAAEQDAGEERGRAQRGTEVGTTAPLDRIVDRTTYRLGPGDGLVLGLWGATNQVFDLVVTPEGDLVVPSLGPVRVAGLTLARAQERLIEASHGVYQANRLTLNLVALRTFRVHVTGRVHRPGSYAATAADRVSGLIEAAGGLAPDGSSRRITLRQADSVEVPVDLDVFLLMGDVALNPLVGMGDVIRVPVRGDSVAIWGAVGTPGYREYRPGDTVSGLLKLVGGLREDAQPLLLEWSSFRVDTSAASTRVVDLDEVVGSPLDPSIRPGDRLLVRARPEWRMRHSVLVEGEVTYPGRYSIVERRTRLSDVFRRAGGVTDRASPENSRLFRGSYAGRPDPEFARLSKMLVEEMTREEYAYFKVRSRDPRGYSAVDIRDALQHPGGVNDVTLMDGDVVEIAERVNTVEVAGRVNRPGLITHSPGKTFRFYLTQAGGPAWNADRSEIRIIKARTGVWLRPAGNVVIEPGDMIFVPEREPINWWSAFMQGILVASQVATVILVIETVWHQ